MTKKLKIGVLGCGPRGLQMARIVMLCPEAAELCAVSDPNPVQLEKARALREGLQCFESSDALLESGLVDAVITEIPPSVHTEYTVKALRRGIHVLGEIPAVNSLEEGNLLWQTVSSAKALYMCASNPHYRSKTLFLLKLAEMGLVGKTGYIETEYMHDMTGMRDQWRQNYESCRYCTHSLGPVLALLKDDEFVSVSCMSTGDCFGNGFAHNAMSALLRTRNNVVVRFLTAFAMPYCGPAHTTVIHTDRGIIKLHNDKALVYSKDLRDYATDGSFIEIPFTAGATARPYSLKIADEKLFAAAGWGHNGSDNAMLLDFIDAIRNGKPSPIGIKAGLAMTYPGIFAAESAREGGALKTITYPWS